VFKRAGQILLIIAVLMATGAHWVILQSVAWSTMLANNLQTTSVYQAVVQTFGGEHPCNLCKHISEGRQSEKKSEFRVTLKKLEFVSIRQVVVFVPPQHFRLLSTPDNVASDTAHEPPVPPPRILSP
jgi:hypothetical protein